MGEGLPAPRTEPGARRAVLATHLLGPGRLCPPSHPQDAGTPGGPAKTMGPGVGGHCFFRPGPGSETGGQQSPPLDRTPRRLCPR